MEGEPAGETPEQYTARIARNYATSLRCWWSREFGYLSILDPFTGEVYDIERTAETPRWMIWRAMDEKNGARTQAPHAPGRGAAPPPDEGAAGEAVPHHRGWHLLLVRAHRVRTDGTLRYGYVGDERVMHHPACPG